MIHSDDLEILRLLANQSQYLKCFFFFLLFSKNSKLVHMTDAKILSYFCLIYMVSIWYVLLPPPPLYLEVISSLYITFED